MTINQASSDSSEIAPYCESVLGKKAENPVVLDVRGLTSISDFFIILSGRSNRHVKSIGEFIREDLKKKGKRPLSIEGMKDGQWTLMDYGNVVIHVFYEPVRSFYDLEGLWADAKRIPIDHYINPENDDAGTIT